MATVLGNTAVDHQQVLFRQPSKYMPDLTTPASPGPLFCFVFQLFILKVYAIILNIFGLKKGVHSAYPNPSRSIIPFSFS